MWGLRKKQSLPARRTHGFTHEVRTPNTHITEQYSFRRNRTLTGSLSSNVVSASEPNAELQSDRVQAHHLRRHRRRLFVMFLAVLMVCIGLSWIIYESIARVAIVVSTGSSTVSQQDKALYEQKIQAYLNGHFFERSRVTLQVKQLTSYLQDNGCPEIKSANISATFTGIGIGQIRLEMRRPVVSWTTANAQVYVDDDGVSFQRNYFSNAAIVAVVDETGIKAQNNQILASNSFLSFMGYAVRSFKEQGFTVSKVVLPADTTRQIQVSLNGVGYPIKLSVDRPAGEQAEDASRAIRYLASKGISAQYIDVRVSGRAYYK